MTGIGTRRVDDEDGIAAGANALAAAGRDGLLHALIAAVAGLRVGSRPAGPPRWTEDIGRSFR